MKKLHCTFGLIALAAILFGLIHGSIAWIVAEVTWDPSATSFPTWCAFVLPLLFYAIGVFIVLLAWLAAWLIACGIRKNRLQKSRGM